jgi:hypothetical protein
MYSTSVGLLLKGFENAIPEPVQEVTEKEEETPEFIEESEKHPRPSRSITSLIDGFKTSISGFFDDGPDKNM